MSTRRHRRSGRLLWSLRRGPLRLTLRGDRDAVVDLRDARRREGGSLGLLALRPGAHAAAQNHLAPVGLDRDTARVDLCAAPERILDLPLDLRGRHPGLQEDEVAD